MRVSELRKLIGKRVEWDEDSAKYRFVRSGILQSAVGLNVRIDDDWKWIPYLKNLRAAEAKPKEEL